VTTDYSYDADGNAIEVSSATGTWEYEYDLARQLTASIDPQDRRTEVDYDDAGRLVGLTHPDATAESFTYDTAGRLTVRTDRAGEEWTYLPDPVGNVVSTTDPLGNTTIHIYDLLGRTTSAKDATGVVSNTAYDPVGREAVRWDALGGSWVTSYDLEGRVASSIDPSGAGSTFEYDAAGRVKKEKLGKYPNDDYVTYSFVRDGTGRVVAVGSPYESESEYDIRGRLISQSNIYDQTTVFEYDLGGRMTKRTNPSGHSTEWEYDSSGRIEQASDPLGNTTVYGWDSADQLRSVTLPRGGVYEYDYDLAGRIHSQTNPLDAVTTYEYDGEGRPTTTTLPSGRVITSIYDAAGNRETTTAGGLTRTFGYDDAGRLTSAVGGGLTLGYSYDNRGLLVESSDGLGDTAYGYDYTGRLTSQTPDTGAATLYTYGPLGAVATVRGAVNLDFSYNDAGQIEQTDGQAPSDVTVVRDYDQAGRLIAIDGRAYSADLAYTADSQIESICEFDGGDCLNSSKSTTYTYDDAGRLTNATATMNGVQLSSETYGWDADGNRTSVTSAGSTPVTAQFDLADQLNATSDGVSYDYDADGNQISRGLSTFGYNPFGELTSVGSTTYARDALGRVSSRAGSPDSQSFSYDGVNGQLRAMQPGAGQLTTLIREPSGSLLGQATEGATAQFAELNAHGDAVSLSDHHDATVRWRNAYNPFGVVDSTIGSAAVPLGFQAMYQDAIAGLVDMGFRHYDPAVGRFNRTDTIVGDLGKPVTFNRYAYGNADPLNHFDPDGHWSIFEGIRDAVSNWADQFFGGLMSPGDSSTSEDPIARFLGSVIETAGDTVVGALDTATTIVECLKVSPFGRESCNAIKQAFTKEGFSQAWHATADPITGCVNTGDAGRCGEASINILEIVFGSKGLVRGIASFAEAIRVPDIPTFDDLRIPAPADSRPTRIPLDCLGHSFAPDTEVLMADKSTKPIRDIKVGDEVMATDPETGEESARAVTQLHDNIDNDLTDITVSAASGAGGQPESATLKTTQHHPFWDATTESWVDARDLQPGTSTLIGPDGEIQHVSAVRNHIGPARMHDLTVSTVHTYYVMVGARPVLVHNMDGENCDLAGGDSADKPRPGLAVLYYYQNVGASGHFSIEVTNGIDVEKMHLMPFNGRAMVSDFPEHYGILDQRWLHNYEVTIPLPNGDGAIDYMRKHVGDQGNYEELSNSCLTFCTRTLNAGGYTEAPTDKRAIPWIKRILLRGGQ
jgi:RHS repeat-associated protein